MKRVLICTIMRDQVCNVQRWHYQLRALQHLCRFDYAFTLSVVENDSKDDTAEWLETWLDRDDPQIPAIVSTGTLGTQRYGSVWSVDRLRNLAAARQQCLDQVGDALQTFDKVAYIEPDISYDPHWCSELILARHPVAANIEPHIYSGWSLRPESNPKESTFLYDVCATRATRDDVCWDVHEQGGTWRGKSLIQTDLGGNDGNCLHRVWSTFNCFCVYDARPFQRGLKWAYVNSRIDPSHHTIKRADGHVEGWLDADTSVMCEQFHEAGFSNVLLNTNCLVRHL